MTLEELSKLIVVIESLAKILAIIVGGLWIYYRFIRQRENFPRVDFKVEIAFVGIHKGRWLTQITALLENKGLVRHTMKNIQFELRCLLDNDDLIEADEEARFQTKIPHVIKKGSWLAPRWTGGTIIDAGIPARYPYVYALPANARFLYVIGEFTYEDGTIHKASRLFQVPLKDKENQSETEIVQANSVLQSPVRDASGVKSDDLTTTQP
jgi:hypothetical protein